MKTALLVIDMLNDFVDIQGNLYVPSARKIVPHICNVIENHKTIGNMVIHVCDRHKKNDKEFEVWSPHAIVGTGGGEIIDELLERFYSKVIPKTRYSGFFKTYLEEVLVDNKITHLELTGLLTNICIFATAVDARSIGFEVVVHSKGTTSMTDEVQLQTLNQLETVFGCKVI